MIFNISVVDKYIGLYRPKSVETQVAENRSSQGIEHEPIYLIVNYEDAYVQPKLLKALGSLSNFRVIQNVAEVPKSGKLIQWAAYEQIDFDNLLENPSSTLACSYIIRYSSLLVF